MNWNARQFRLLLQATSGLLLIGTFATLAWAVWSPVPEVESNVKRKRPLKTTLDESAAFSLAELTPLLNRRLREPLYDPPPVKKERKKDDTEAAKRKRDRRSSSFDIQLVGTVIERGRSMAILMDRKGNIDLKPVGDTLELDPGGVRVEAIAPEEVTLNYQGRQMTVAMKNRNER